MTGETNSKIATVRNAIEYLQQCKPLVSDDLVAQHEGVYDKLTLLLRDLVYEDDATWETLCPARAPVTEDDLLHPLIGPAEREELTEKLYRVLHLVRPEMLFEDQPEIYKRDTEEFPALAESILGGTAILIWDVEKQEVVCPAYDFFRRMRVTEFSWKGGEG